MISVYATDIAFELPESFKDRSLYGFTGPSDSAVETSYSFSQRSVMSAVDDQAARARDFQSEYPDAQLVRSSLMMQTQLGDTAVSIGHLRAPDGSSIFVDAYAFVREQDLVHIGYESAVSGQAAIAPGVPSPMDHLLASLHRIGNQPLREPHRVDVGRISYVLPRRFSAGTRMFEYYKEDYIECRLSVRLTTDHGFAEPHWSWERVLITDDVLTEQLVSTEPIQRTSETIGEQRRYAVERVPGLLGERPRSTHMIVSEAWIHLRENKEAHVLLAAPAALTAAGLIWTDFLTSVRPGG